MGEWTYSRSLGFSAFFVTGFSYSISWSIDSHGNFVIQKTKANFSDEGGIIGLCSTGVSNSTSVTKLDSVYDLEGKWFSVGASVSILGTPAFVGGDVLLSTETGGVDAFSVSEGLGYGIDVHAMETVTETTTSFNIIHEIKTVWNKFKNWLGL